MKHLTLLLAFAAAALAQPAITLSGSFSGATAKIDIKLAGGGTQPTALQFDLKLPPGAVIAQGALPGGTRLFQNTVAGVATVVIAGSQAAIPDGVIAAITAPAASFTFSPSGYLAVDVTATVLPTVAILPYTLTPPPSPCDLNGDGVVDSLDVRNAADQADHVFACGNADLNSDGFCNSIDVQLVVNAAATGGACKTTGK